ncbi:MAG TPA: 16S rRNA (cytosine(1402)-N(4))-methyltransferase RsmH, partial [bacterium]|nr:16S rRNA (cytosine(1402)-N(4))-methyltransferase RsmH [bacterium]
AAEILKRLPRGRYVGLDQDADALQHAGRALSGDPRVTLHQANFADLLDVLTTLGIPKVDSVLMDIGVSSLQLDTAARGFSFQQSGPLDMRMDASAPLSAADVVNRYPEEKLAQILREYGEEPKARALARAIVKARAEKPFQTTDELAALAKRVLYRPGPQKHPATRLFQALRMEVNGELKALERGLEAARQALKPGGRLAVITFHSLEDRLVKQFMKRESVDCLCPPDLPLCRCGHRASLEILTPKPVTASQAELESNPRARSAKLRVARRLGEAA